MAFFNERNRIIFLEGEINSALISEIVFDILNINAMDEEEENKSEIVKYKRKPIKLYINSPGGSVTDMWGLVGVMEASKTPIYTYCTGYADSAATLVLMAGKKRYAYKHASVLIHSLSGITIGKLKDIRDTTQHLENLQEKINKYLISKSKIDKDFLMDIIETKKDFIIEGKDIVTMGIVDKLI